MVSAVPDSPALKSRTRSRSTTSDSRDSPSLKSRTRSGSSTDSDLAATKTKRSLSISEPCTPDASAIAMQPHLFDAEPPSLVLNSSPDLTAQPLNAKIRDIFPVSLTLEQSRGDSGSSTPSLQRVLESSPRLAARQPSSKADIYTARWKISASDILKNLQEHSGLIKDVKHRFTVHKSVIVGSELVTYFVASYICPTRQDAVDLGLHLVMDDILEHEFQEDMFKDKYLFYKVCPDAEHNAARIGANSDESDGNSEDAFIGDEEPATSVQTAQIGNSGHSALAKYLMRKSLAGPKKDDYLNDSALLDDLVAEAAADRHVLPHIF